MKNKKLLDLSACESAEIKDESSRWVKMFWRQFSLQLGAHYDADRPVLVAQSSDQFTYLSMSPASHPHYQNLSLSLSVPSYSKAAGVEVTWNQGKRSEVVIRNER